MVLNPRPTNGVSTLAAKLKHILTSDSQETREPLPSKDWTRSRSSIVDKDIDTSMDVTPIPHWGQAKKATENLVMPDEANSKVMVADSAFIVNSWPAHVSPSSPDSEGILPSSRTVEVGVAQIILFSLPNRI